MSFTNISYQNQAVFAISFPAPAAAYLVRVVEAAEASVMEELVQQVLDEVIAQNVLIAAAYPDNPELLLTIADMSLAGGGDGHTFVCTLTFVPADSNGVAVIIAAGPISPTGFVFKFAIAGEQDSFLAAVNDALARLIGPADAPVIFQDSAGAAKGTRFMFGVGGVPEGV